FDYQGDRAGNKVRWGSFGSVAYLPSEQHELRLMGLHSQAGSKETAVYRMFDDNTDRDAAATQFRWVERGLTLGQLSGRHTFDPLDQSELGWDVVVALATRSEPDRRDVVYNFSPANRETDPDNWVLRDGSESGRHFFSEQDELSTNLKLDYTQPIVDSLELKTGGLVSRKQRSFEARRFALRAHRTDRDLRNDPGLRCEAGPGGSYPFD